MRSRFALASIAITATALVALGCITPQAPTDTVSSITAPTATTGGTAVAPGNSTAPPAAPATIPATVTVAYRQDLKPIFDADCLRCHSGSRPDGNYAMTTYTQVMRAVAAGNDRSVLVRITQRGGSMYRYWSGSAQSKADLVRTWVVSNAAAEAR
ncbi:MAG: hypothetical protein ABL971_16920 [Vicinamibacterales bacterium]